MLLKIFSDVHLYKIKNLYSNASKSATVINSKEAGKSAYVIFANHADGRLDKVSVVPYTLELGKNTIPATGNFLECEGGKVYVYLWDSMQTLVPLATPLNTVNVWMLGDSIMADWGAERYPQEGWGEAFKEVVAENANVNNRAISGFTAERFYNEVWSTNTYDASKVPIINDIVSGDYVLVSFLHNDYCETAPGKTHEGDTTYINTYKEYIEKFVDDCKAKGANVVLVVPPNKGVDYNFHAAEMNGVDVGDYSAVIPAVAEEKGVTCVDVHEWTLNETAEDAAFLDTVYLTKNYINSIVADGKLTEEELASHTNSNLSKSGYDLTHVSVNGCKLIAEYVAEQLKSANIGFDSYLK